MPRLKRPEDRRSLAFVAFQLLLVIAGYLTWESQPVWLLVLHVAATAWFAFLTAVIVHNTVHVPIFVERRHNRLNQLFLSVAFGHPVSVYVRGHNMSHHGHVQTARDVMRTTKARFHHNLINQVLFFFIVGKDLALANEKYVKLQKEKGTDWYRQLRLERWCVRGFVLLCFLVDWKAALLFLAIPRIFANWGIVGTNYFQHDGCDETSPDNHSRSLTGPIINWWTFNNGFHGMHHVDATIHWADLPAAHAADLGPRSHPSLSQPNALAWAWRFYVWPGKRQRYDGRPYALPPEVPDEDWMPDARTVGVSLGAVGS